MNAAPRAGKYPARELFNEFIARSRVARYYIRTVDAPSNLSPSLPLPHPLFFSFYRSPFFSHSVVRDYHPTSMKLIRDEREKKGDKNCINIARDLILINRWNRWTRQGRDRWSNESRRSFPSQLIVRSIPSSRAPRILRKGGKKPTVHCAIFYPRRGITPIPCYVPTPQKWISPREIYTA